MKLAIVGNGSIGGLVLYRAHRLDIPVLRLTRTGQAGSIAISDKEQAPVTLSPMTQTLDMDIDADMVIVPLKAFQILPALKQMADHLAAQTTVVLLHNGMGTADKALETVSQPLIMATTSYGAYRPHPGEVTITGHGSTQAGWLRTPASRSLKDAHSALLNRLLPPCQWFEDIRHAQWQKLAVNAVINPLTALHRCRNGELLKPAFHSQMTRLCEETAAVMEAEGMIADPRQLLARALTVCRQTADNYSSMNRDVDAHRPTEMEYITGFLLQRARAHGLDTPAHQHLFEEVMAITPPLGDNEA
ncbi:2-dehydropantoate 2-reductase [Aestuariibacter halophilus]|uniref:2-dehydropantoate 2-reductase n=1 Tax=Fluctibacter halophilus TaxID=226011 RepID=A0ABS8G863_9ALTE|nr:2-dehydropantoate 2-reductase [Aestuariibacter halophilus]MCC2616730.1 2-dehydropantoate 2-reductase [Aestuariibacter halophilus]